MSGNYLLGRCSPRWRRALLLTVPAILALNYLLVFQWTFFKELSSRVTHSGGENSKHDFKTVTSHSQAQQDDNGLDYWTWDTQTQFQTHNVSEDVCANFPQHLLSKIQVVLKVGAADSRARTESQLSSVIKCIPNALIISDLDHSYGNSRQAVDVLASLPAKTNLKPEDFQVYERQKNLTAAGKEKELLETPEGWRVDRYKFLPGVEQAVKRAPQAEWYVFLESDTYIFWDNLFRLLEHFDHELPWYFGSPSPGRNINPENSDEKVWFAYGGCGFVLSSTAAHRLVDRKRNFLGKVGTRVTEQYKQDIQDDCCGDSILGWALHDRAKVDLSGLWPMFNPHGLGGVPFGRLYWCEPVISLHKSDPKDFVPLWMWENSRDRRKGPILYADLFDYHRLGTFSKREDWDNADWDGFNYDDGHPAHASFDACALACSTDDDCVQFTYHMRHCWMARSFRLGRQRGPTGEEGESEYDRRFFSGWDVEKMRRWKEENACQAPHWVKPSIDRKF